MAAHDAEGLRRGDYRDPCEVLISRESKTCAGCAWVRVVFNAPFCGAERRYGKRCDQYFEAENGKG